MLNMHLNTYLRRRALAVGLVVFQIKQLTTLLRTWLHSSIINLNRIILSLCKSSKISTTGRWSRSKDNSISLVRKIRIEIIVK